MLSAKKGEQMSFAALLSSINHDSTKTHISVAFELKQKQIGKLKDALNQHSNIKSVSLCLQNLGHRGVEKLLPLEHVEELDLSQNGINDEGICFIARAVKNCKALTMLNLSENSFGLSGCVALGACIKDGSPPLQSLILQSCNLSHRHVTALCPLLENSSLKQLDLQNNVNVSSMTSQRINTFLKKNFKSDTKRKKDLIAIVQELNPAKLSTQRPRKRRRATLLPPNTSTNFKPQKRKRGSDVHIETYTNDRSRATAQPVSTKTNRGFESFDAPLTPNKKIRID